MSIKKKSILLLCVTFLMFTVGCSNYTRLEYSFGGDSQKDKKEKNSSEALIADTPAIKETKQDIALKEKKKFQGQINSLERDVNDIIVYIVGDESSYAQRALFMKDYIPMETVENLKSSSMIEELSNKLNEYHPVVRDYGHIYIEYLRQSQLSVIDIEKVILNIVSRNNPASVDMTQNPEYKKILEKAYNTDTEYVDKLDKYNNEYLTDFQNKYTLSIQNPYQSIQSASEKGLSRLQVLTSQLINDAATELMN